jgi:hypothetical protein
LNKSCREAVKAINAIRLVHIVRLSAPSKLVKSEHFWKELMRRIPSDQKRRLPPSFGLPRKYILKSLGTAQCSGAIATLSTEESFDLVAARASQSHFFAIPFLR